jgi:hypothetical protein
MRVLSRCLTRNEQLRHSSTTRGLVHSFQTLNGQVGNSPISIVETGETVQHYELGGKNVTDNPVFLPSLTWLLPRENVAPGRALPDLTERHRARLGAS